MSPHDRERLGEAMRKIARSSPSADEFRRSLERAFRGSARPWSDEYSVPIARALAQNGVTGAAIFEHRPDVAERGMHLVRCKSEPDVPWSYYLVRPSVTRSDAGEVEPVDDAIAEGHFRDLLAGSR